MWVSQTRHQRWTQTRLAEIRAEDASANRIASAFRLEKDVLFWVCEARHAALIVKGFNVGSADSEPHSNQMYEK